MPTATSDQRPARTAKEGKLARRAVPRTAHERCAERNEGDP